MRISKLRLQLMTVNCPHWVVAQEAGFPKTRLSEYVNGKRRIPALHVMRLCEVLGCRPEDIIGMTEIDDESAVLT